MPLEASDLQALSQLLTSAIQQSATQAAQAVAANNAQQNGASRVSSPPVCIPAYKSDDFTSIQDYFTRCEWSFQLSRVAEAEYKNYILVHMGSELNNALKILISPKVPEDLSYSEIKMTLVCHFDRKKNQYAESVKFRQIVQRKEESLADFTLRLRQAATHCNYGNFLERMLTEQMLFGLDSSSICDEIIAKEPANFKEAYEIAHRLEASHKTAVDLKNSAVNSNTAEEATLKVSYKPNKHDKQKRALPSSMVGIYVSFETPNVTCVTKQVTLLRCADQKRFKCQMKM